MHLTLIMDVLHGDESTCKQSHATIAKGYHRIRPWLVISCLQLLVLSATADAQGARLTLANDPDADRLAVAERCAASPGGWRLFDGNQIGILLAHWLWQNRSDKEPGKALQYAMLASTVSSKMIKRMAEKEGFV